MDYIFVTKGSHNGREWEEQRQMENTLLALYESLLIDIYKEKNDILFTELKRLLNICQDVLWFARITFYIVI